MKNQYFGDLRDLFKYDLIESIMEGINKLQRFTFIPMLTEYDPNVGDGNKRNFKRAVKNVRPGTKNEELMTFLFRYTEIEPDKRDFREIAKCYPICMKYGFQ